MQQLRKISLLLMGFGLPVLGFSQIVINEVSQGPSGSQEYVEFLVEGGACAAGCIDLRLWIFDDNNGYLNGGPTTGVGIASGACRFANDPFWSCIPFGTLITIYNDGDPNPSLPGADLSMTDGNCNLVIPISSALFDRHTTQPNSGTSVYPTTGWVSGGSWTPISMANGVDGFQIYDAANLATPVFSLGWGSANTNGDIWMGAGSATDDVFYADNNISCDNSVQGNWVQGCAGDIGACGSDDGTPGAPNNAANAACISTMNNNCVPLPILTLDLISVTDPLCFGDCNGSATTAASTGTPPYTYLWDDPLAQTTATASGLCDGIYNATVTDASGCTAASVPVVITQPPLLTSPTSGSVAVCNCLCSGSAYVFPTSGTPNYTVTWDNGYGDQFQTGLCDGVYNVTVTDANGCISTGTVTLP
ncbi:MAG: SprB repeat-containing protein [Flavobacteriales bacterium]|nr:SprB repeat-containing protein [Flavobacteriales bacterium]